MDYFVGAVLPYICSPKALTLACYALVALVHILTLWTQHVFMWNSRFDCKGIGCPSESSTTELVIECAVLYLLIVLMLLSYWRCILTPAGSPPPTFQVQPQPPASPALQAAGDVQLAIESVEMTSGVEGRRR